MKKISFLLAALLMTLCFAGCTEYRKPGGDNPDNPGTSKPGPDNPENPDNPYPEDAFTVSLKLNGEKFIPSDTISAYWYDLNGFEIYSSEFNSEGVAVQAGLDGDYRVTLSEYSATASARKPNIPIIPTHILQPTTRKILK